MFCYLLGCTGTNTGLVGSGGCTLPGTNGLRGGGGGLSPGTNGLGAGGVGALYAVTLTNTSPIRIAVNFFITVLFMLVLTVQGNPSTAY